MPEETLFETEKNQSLAEIAEYLRHVADALESGGKLTLKEKGQSVTVEIPENPVFEVEIERETSSEDDQVEMSVEFEIEWEEAAADEEPADKTGDEPADE